MRIYVRAGLWIIVHNFFIFTQKNECLWINYAIFYDFLSQKGKNNPFLRKIKKLSTVDNSKKSRRKRKCGQVIHRKKGDFAPKRAEMLMEKNGKRTFLSGYPQKNKNRCE